MRRAGGLAAAALLLAASAAGVAAEPMGFQLRPSSPAVIGAPLVLVGAISYPDRFSLAPEPVEKDTGPFTVVRAALGPAAQANGTKTQEVRLTVVAWQVGDQVLPPLTWNLSGQGAAESLKSPPVAVRVLSPDQSPGKEDDIRDIKPPLSPRVWPAVVCALLLIALAAWAFRRFGRPTETPSALAPPEDTRPPDVVALEALARLNYRESTPKEFYDRMSDIVRLYLERRYGIPALVLTTTDLVRQMRQAEIERAVVVEAKAFFDRCDLAKFAKLEPDETAAERDRETAADVIRVTAPPPPETASAAPAPPPAK